MVRKRACFHLAKTQLNAPWTQASTRRSTNTTSRRRGRATTTTGIKSHNGCWMDDGRFSCRPGFKWSLAIAKYRNRPVFTQLLCPIGSIKYLKPCARQAAVNKYQNSLLFSFWIFFASGQHDLDWRALHWNSRTCTNRLVWWWISCGHWGHSSHLPMKTWTLTGATASSWRRTDGALAVKSGRNVIHLPSHWCAYASGQVSWTIESFLQMNLSGYLQWR